MQMLSEDDVNLRALSNEELDLAWDSWFDLVQTTNDWAPPYSHDVFVNQPSPLRPVQGRHTPPPQRGVLP